MEFDLFGQLKTELAEYFKKKVHIAGTVGSDSVRFLKREDMGYDFSQWQMLNTIELYYNSKFESGIKDSEGKRKVFLNVCKFRSNVASKQIDLDVKDFVFVPDLGDALWPSYFLNKKFHKWAKLNGFGQFINDVVQTFPKYGTIVAKKVGKSVERTKLLNLRNPHDAESLKTARFVIEDHHEMTFDEMEQMKGWDLTGFKEMDFGETAHVFERYGRVPTKFFNKQKGDYENNSAEPTATVDTMSILSPQSDRLTKEGKKGNILFLEQIDERPYEEAHWEKIDGRWLGVGEIENQIENQIMRNTVANQRRAALDWSSKKVFQSKDPDINKNLVRDVQNGDVIRLGPNGDISQVNVATQSLAEFQQVEDTWERNSDQKSFTYEVATGEALPSGTPFRLGVVLSNAVNSHFDLKRENLGLFLNRLIENQVLPLFKKQNRDEHTMMIFADEEGVQELKQELVKIHVSQIAKDQLLNGILPDLEQIQQKVEAELASRKGFQMDFPARFYEEVKASSTLIITGENLNIEKRLETLTNLRSALVEEGDIEGADRLLKTITALTGENRDALVGVRKPVPKQMAAPGGQGPGQMPGMPQPGNQPVPAL